MYRLERLKKAGESASSKFLQIKIFFNHVITVKPYGGLGNRIRALYSVLGINQERNHPIKILWDCHKELNCPFDELFLTPKNCRVRNMRQGFYRKVSRFALNKMHLSNLRKYTYDLVLSDKKIVKLRKENADFFELFNHSSIYIETCRHFFKDPKITDLLTINPAIENEAQQTYSTFGPNTYGIHIRRTDNFMSKKFSPPSAFKQLIREKLEEENDAQFFLATDEKKVEKEFINEFGNKIITRENEELDRNTEQGVKDALIAMVCLSNTQKIYGSYFSSFTSVSAMLSGIEYENVLAENTDVSTLNS